ncbi:MAG TPA: cell division protein ZapA [Gemmatimonadaceae bacterium]|jgi:cell division protein ZapA|nr:cell division protein ZapA [Gemmatimonadaceae bacterium]
MTKKNVVSVTIQGAEYTLRTETSPDDARAIAEYVDQVISETMESGARIESHKAAILAALRIAGELFEARAQADVLAAEMGALSDEIRPWLPPAKRNS